MCIFYHVKDFFRLGLNVGDGHLCTITYGMVVVVYIYVYTGQLMDRDKAVNRIILKLEEKPLLTMSSGGCCCSTAKIKSNPSIMQIL